MPASSSPAVFTVDVDHCAGNVFLLHCHGRLVSGATHALSSAVTPLIPQTKRIVLDLADVQHTDSMGIGALVRLFVSAKASGCNLELMHLSKQIRNVLGITNLGTVFTVIGENGIKFM